MNDPATALAMAVFGVVFIVSGFLYLRRPTLYRRGIWLKTSIAIRLLSERNYFRYMRGLGVAFIILGIELLITTGVNEFSN